MRQVPEIEPVLAVLAVLLVGTALLLITGNLLIALIAAILGAVGIALVLHRRRPR
jgi:hypothetical protein